MASNIFLPTLALHIALPLIFRPKLGSLVFGDDTKRKTLNKIVHPAIQKKMIGPCMFVPIYFTLAALAFCPLDYLCPNFYLLNSKAYSSGTSWSALLA
jgi:hypothetical protein